MTISEFPDDVLLEVFSFYLDHQRDNEDAWHVLVHVCRRWRCIVSASPRRLHLRLFITNKSPVKEMSDVWPELPIVIHATYYKPWSPRVEVLSEVTNVIAVLEHHDRVCDIHLMGFPKPLLNIFDAMKKPFPSLVNLTIVSEERNGSTIPDSFLGGSAPRLESLELYDVQCPAIEKLLLSTPNLVSLSLSGIPHSSSRLGYVSPEAMVNSLSVLTSLKSLHLRFHRDWLRFHQPSGHPSPFSPVVLPAFTDFFFYGDQGYLEDIVSRIDTPLLAKIFIGLSVSVTVTPPLRDFISRTEAFGACSKIDILHSGTCAKVRFFRPDGEGL